MINLLNDVVGVSSDDSTSPGEDSGVPVVPGDASYSEALNSPIEEWQKQS